MTEQMPPLLHVCDQAWGTVRPKAATIHVTLSGSKLFSDRSALTKSEELRRLVEALRERGLPDDAVALEGASLDVSTGLFSRSSSVTYRVAVRIADPDCLPAALEVISESKQATLTHIEWDDAGGASDELIAMCVERAVAKAKHIAARLGVELGALHELHEEGLAEHAQPQPHGFAFPVASRTRAMASMSVSNELAGLELAPPKQVGVRVRLSYRVGSPAAASATTSGGLVSSAGVT